MRDPRNAFAEKLVALGKHNQKIYALSCDSASGGGLSPFFAAYPERSVEIGISEQNAVSIAAAMSRENLIPVLVIINPFLTMRAFEQIRDDLGYVHSNVKVVGSGGGLAYSTLGATHIAVEDISLMRTIPNLTILAPGDADEVEFALEQAIAIDGPVYIRMPRQKRNEPCPVSERSLVLGRGEVFGSGNRACIFTYGPSLEQAIGAQKLLSNSGISIRVVNLTTVKPLDEACVLEHAAAVDYVFTLEEQIATGGLTDAVARTMLVGGVSKPFCAFTVTEGCKQTGPYEALLDFYGLSAEKVAEKIKQQLSR